MSKYKKKLLPLVSIFLIAGFLLTSLASYFVSRRSLHVEILDNELPLTSDNVYSEIQRDLLRPIFISSLMASDTFLRDWMLAGEKNPDQVAKYLKEIKEQFNTFSSFFISDHTMHYYYPDGILKTISPDEKRDVWYYRVREMDHDYEINVDIDMANNDAMTIFINYKVYDYDGNYIGATGVGLTVNAVKELIDAYQKKYDRQIYFFDNNGVIKLAGEHNIWADSNGVHKHLATFYNNIYSLGKTSFNYKRDGKTVHTNVRHISEFDWYLVVEQQVGKATKEILTTLIINLLVCAIITIVVLLLVTTTIKKYQTRIDTLSGIVPICSYCKKIRDDKGYWNQVEMYIAKHTDAEFSHGICPSCREQHFPEYPQKGKA